MSLFGRLFRGADTASGIAGQGAREQTADPRVRELLNMNFLMPIDDIFSVAGRGTIVTGDIRQGVVQVGDAVDVIGPNTKVNSVVTSIDAFEKRPVLLKVAQVGGNTVGLGLRGILPSQLEIGMVVAKAGSLSTMPPLRPRDAILADCTFFITRADVEPPVGEMDSARKEHHAKLQQGRKKAVQHRRDLIANMLDQAEAQGVPRAIIAAKLKDPCDDPLPGWHSLAILFDWNKMDTMYGRQVFDLFFRNLRPSDLTADMVLHFGDLIQCDTFCAVVARSQNATDIATTCGRFGPEVDGPGLCPYGIRFLTADSKDGHLIARSFSLPIAASLQGIRVVPDSTASGVGSMIEAAVRGTEWRV